MELGVSMLIREMVWVPHRVPVCVFERSRGDYPRNKLRLLFLGRLMVLPILFLGANGYFCFLAERQRWRSVVMAELKHIMVAASLDNSYQVEDWFMKKDQLFVHVTRRAQRIGRSREWLSKRLKFLLVRRQSR